MKILFYVLALGAGIFGLLVLFQAVQRALSDGGVDIFQFAIGVIGIVLAFLWMMRAKAAK